ncbi:MAG: NAD(+) diphosphatase [Saccharofermentans sp.]|nr:NAD(+) diphosphatase [Saccharofermentans sp.]
MIQDISPAYLKNEFKPEARALPESPVFFFDGNNIAVKEDFTVPLAKDIRSDDLIFLFELTGTDCFLTRTKPEGIKLIPLRDLRRKGVLTKDMAFASYTAYHLASWYNSSDFCGRCGAKTSFSKAERARICPDCGEIIYPRINPAVILGILNHDHSKILLTKYARRDFNFYALVAGFTEIGETFEQTCAREAMEETGLKIKDITYYKSQPWGSALDILTGFYCTVDGPEDIKMDTNELKTAVWCSPEEVVLQPDDYSLTNEMMKRFKDGNL